MATFELKLPKMGESVAEATITSWLKEVGDTIEIDEPILEIATDKVDSEVPSEVSGVLKEKKYQVDDVVKVGETIAIIETDADADVSSPSKTEAEAVAAEVKEAVATAEALIEKAETTVNTPDFSTSEKFYSPLVKNIAKTEGISLAELDAISGSGKEGRVTKQDLLDYIANGRNSATKEQAKQQETFVAPTPVQQAPKPTTPVNINAADEIIEMTRMGKLIAEHMVASKQTSAHVQSFIECDVTEVFNWRNKVKNPFLEREGEKLTFTPIFMMAVVKAIKDFPMVNISVNGSQIIKKKSINLGMATALPDGNLIVPVIKNADQLNLLGMAKAVNDLADRARQGKLKPDDTQGGTYTVTNVGTFGSVFGTPIINQPQVGILALGAIRKVPAVIETPQGDFIGIRMKMFLSHSYDHRVVNGALGGQFIQRVAEYIENFEPDYKL